MAAPDREQILAWIDEEDAATRTARADRARLIVEDLDPDLGRLFIGGPLAMQAFEEARHTYLNGLYLACILLVQVHVEHTLGALFRMMDRDDMVRELYAKMLTAARSERFLSDAEFETFDRLRRDRNPYTHPRSFDDSTHPMRRAWSMNLSPDDLLADDAAAAVTAMMALGRRAPFLLRDDRGR